MASSQFDDWDPALLAALQNYVATQSATPTCPKHHDPVPCLYRDSLNNKTCFMEQLVMQWRQRDATFPFESHPLAVALGKEGADTFRARMVISYEGFGMTVESSSALLAAYRLLKQAPTANVPSEVKCCNQCRPGTNTFILQGENYSPGSCHRIPINLTSDPSTSISNNKNQVLCLGASGKLKWCNPGEFMAVSHVWDHGWQGSSEDGLCSRVLDLLLSAASFHGLEYIWLDVAMISSIKEIRAMSINSMNQVYSSAKITLVCDRLLFATAAIDSPRQQAMALASCYWMTRVWTMQEALLSKNVVLHFRDTHVAGQDLLQTLTDGPDTSLNLEKHPHWQSFGAINSLYTMFSSNAPVLNRVVSMSKERLTTKRTDLIRALYPLFSATWPGPDTTMDQGMQNLIHHLSSDDAGRLVSLHGPIMPSPFAWAPLSIAGCSGGLQGAGMQVTTHGLLGEWAYWRVLRLWRTPNIKHRKDGFSTRMVQLTGCKYDLWNVRLEGWEDEIWGLGIYYREEDEGLLYGEKQHAQSAVTTASSANHTSWSSWFKPSTQSTPSVHERDCSNENLYLLRAFNTGQTVMKDLDYFHLVKLDVDERGKAKIVDGEKRFHRVGSAAGGSVELDGHKARELVVQDGRLRGFMY